MQYFKWDALGRLIRSKNDKAETHYRYDALGRRIEKQKQHIQAGRSQYTETTAYGWDGDTLAYESTNLYTKHYVYENSSFVPLIQATYRQQINQHQTPQWTNQYDYDKDPLWHTEQKANPFDRVWFYHCDHLGTPQEMSDQTGAIVWSAEYKAWGECKTENHTKRDIWDSEIITNNLRFQGQYFDQETGLHYNRFRYYSPYVGRFISKDPIGLLGGLNTFAYAPNPVEWIDPFGLATVYLRNAEVYVGKAGEDARKRYGKCDYATDIFTGIPDGDVARGVEQVVYERMIGNARMKSFVTNEKRPVNMDDKNKIWRYEAGVKWLKSKYGSEANYNKVIDKKIVEHATNMVKRGFTNWSCAI